MKTEIETVCRSAGKAPSPRDGCHETCDHSVLAVLVAIVENGHDHILLLEQFASLRNRSEGVILLENADPSVDVFENGDEFGVGKIAVECHDETSLF